jgi:N-acetylneuraminate synthase/N,N'-diacetyllegionaminate synthase
MAEVRIGDRRIGPGCPCFVIAEAGINHNGNLDMAHRLIDLAADAGADAVKFQTFKAELVISTAAPKAGYQLENTDPGESQLQMAKNCELAFDDFRALQQHCRERGIVFLSTPFDHDSLDFLCHADVPAIKVASGEITNFPLLHRAAAAGKPVILSTGMSRLSEVEAAVAELRRGGCRELVVLHCVSNYPADPGDANLRAMLTIGASLGVPVGYSDHTLGLTVALASVALGACILEKHFTLDTKLPGPDHIASLDPEQLGELVQGVRCVEAALGDGVKSPCNAELATLAVARRSLFLSRDVAVGQLVEPDSLLALRPAGGISPDELAQVRGRKAVRGLKAGDMLQWQDLT